MTEIEVLKSIRLLAVREENPKVARVTFSRMVQDRDEPARAFAARLRGQARVCRFIKACAHCGRDSDQDQGEERVAEYLCVGLADQEIQADLLKDPNQNMTVEETLRFIEIRATGKRSALTMTSSNTTHEVGESQESEAIGARTRG